MLEMESSMDWCWCHKDEFDDDFDCADYMDCDECPYWTDEEDD